MNEQTEEMKQAEGFDLTPPAVDKFAGSYEELKRSYEELEKKLGSRFTGVQTPDLSESTEAPEAPKEERPKQSETEKPKIEVKAKNVAEHDAAHLEHLKQQYGDSFGEYFEHYMTNGTLNEKQFAELEKRGFSRNVVEHLIDVENRAAVAMLQQQKTEEAELKQVAGGEESYSSMVAWAQKNLGESEIEAFDSLMESGTRAQKQLAIEALSAKFQKSQPVETAPKTIIGGNKPVGFKPFRSRAEIIEAMQDPKYNRDEAYRNDVARRLSVSNV